MRASELSIQALSPEQFPQTHSVLQAGVAEGVAPGFVAGFWMESDPDEAWIAAVGSRRWLPSVQPMQTDTIFDLASVTKVYATSVLTALLVDRGWLSYEASVRAFFPAYPYSEIRIRHLLSHTGGFAAWAPFWERLKSSFAPSPIERIAVSDRQKLMRELVFQEAPDAPVEARSLYSDISFLILGFILEEATSMSLDRAIDHLVWEPMGLERSYFAAVTSDAERSRDDRVAATEQSEWRGGVLQGQVHDDNCWAMGGYGGHAGAFADARDILHFVRRLFSGFVSLPVLDRMWTRVSVPLDCSRTLGWDTVSPGSSLLGALMSRASVGHWGFTGTSLWIDPQKRFGVTLLSNRVHPSRENNRIREFRPRFHDALIQDLRLNPRIKYNPG